MLRKTLIFFAISSLCLLAAHGPAAAQDNQQVRHASLELIELAAEFREFRSPLFRPRTWSPTHRVEGIPDYAAVKREQIDGLKRFRERLDAMQPRGWLVHDQVDYLLLRSEMDDVYFEQHVLREVEINPAWYIEQAIDGVAREIPDVIPYSEKTAKAIIAAFERTGPIVQQGIKNIILSDASPELAAIGIRHVASIREKYEAGAKLFEPHFPASLRGNLRRSAAAAARELEDYGEWIERNKDRMQGQANVGQENMLWFFNRVNFAPWNREELLSLAEHEKNRFLMSIEIEETKNMGLKELTMPTTQEWIEWFRLTYLQTKYWLKDNDIISFPDYVGESYLEEGVWQEPFDGIGNNPGMLGMSRNEKPENTKRSFVVPEDHWYANTYWEGTMRLDPITDYQHSDWPGHFFEGQVTQRHPCPIRAVHRDTGFSQGWAYYWEEFFMDMGYSFLRGPRTRELTYNFLLLRAVRIPMDILLSEGELSVDAAVKYQIDRVPTMEDHISRAEVDMYVRWPYQATSYLVGKKQIEQILGETILENDFSVNWRKFHDSLLQYGQIAPALIRWELTGKDDQVQRFWDDPETPGGK